MNYRKVTSLFISRKRPRLQQGSKAHCAIIHIVVNVFALEESLSNQPLAAKVSRSVDTRRAVVAVLGEGKGLGQDVEVLAVECQANGGRRIAGIVAGESIAVLHGLDSSLLEQCLDLRRGSEDDSRAGICDDGDAAADRLAIQRDVAGDDPLVAGRHRDQVTAELVRRDSAIVERTALAGGECQPEAAGGQRALVAQALEKGCLIESAAVDACIANEAIVGECGR